MYIFQTGVKDLDVQLPDKSVVTFSGFSFSTEDSVKGEALTKISGKSFWRVDNIKVELPKEGETPPEAPKKRGRPKMIQGMRTVEGD